MDIYYQFIDGLQQTKWYELIAVVFGIVSVFLQSRVNRYRCSSFRYYGDAPLHILAPMRYCNAQRAVCRVCSCLLIRDLI